MVQPFCLYVYRLQLLGIFFRVQLWGLILDIMQKLQSLRNNQVDRSQLIKHCNLCKCGIGNFLFLFFFFFLSFIYYADQEIDLHICICDIVSLVGRTTSAIFLVDLIIFSKVPNQLNKHAGLKYTYATFNPTGSNSLSKLYKPIYLEPKKKGKKNNNIDEL